MDSGAGRLNRLHSANLADLLQEGGGGGGGIHSGYSGAKTKPTPSKKETTKKGNSSVSGDV